MQEEVIKFYSDYFTMVHKAAYDAKHGNGLNILLFSKQMLQRLPIVLPQVEAGNTSENLLNEIHQIIFLCIKQKKLLKSIQQYNELNKVIKQNRYYIYQF